MLSVFFAYTFNVEDHELVDKFCRLLESHGLKPTSGQTLGGAALTPEVRKKIDNADALVALLTRREPISGGRWTTSEWVKDELGYARARDKPCIAIIEDGVEPGGAYGENEYIALNRESPLESFLRLSETVSAWKDQIGRSIEVRIQPEEVAAIAANDDGHGAACRYRFIAANYVPMDWRDGRVYQKPGGVFLYVRGIGEHHQLEVRLEQAALVWRSPVGPLVPHVTLGRMTPL